MSSQKMGPRLMAKKATYAIRVTTATQARVALAAIMRNAKPSTPRETIIPAMPVSNRGRRPARSMSHIETTVMMTFTRPIPAVARMAPAADEIPADWMMVGA
jgi:hypothetical protein